MKQYSTIMFNVFFFTTVSILFYFYGSNSFVDFGFWFGMICHIIRFGLVMIVVSTQGSAVTSAVQYIKSGYNESEFQHDFFWGEGLPYMVFSFVMTALFVWFGHTFIAAVWLCIYGIFYYLVNVILAKCIGNQITEINEYLTERGIEISDFDETKFHINRTISEALGRNKKDKTDSK